MTGVTTQNIVEVNGLLMLTNLLTVFSLKHETLGLPFPSVFLEGNDLFCSDFVNNNSRNKISKISGLDQQIQ